MTETTRDTALRAVLVDTVAATNPPRRRWRLLVGGGAAFVLAGALTGGALVTIGLQQQDADSSGAAALIDTGAAQNLDFVGSPVARVADAPTSLHLPARPRDSARLALAAQCGSDRTVDVTGSGLGTVHLTCGDAATVVRPTPDGALDLVFTPSTPGGLTVWAAWAVPSPLPKVSSQQTAAIQDGVVTRTEYLAAWNRYLGCMRALGQPIDGGTQTQMFVATAIPGEAYAADARCNPAEFGEVDSTWQTEHAHAHDPKDGTYGAKQYDPTTDDPRFAG